MTASDPFVSGTLDDISTTETGNWPKPAVTMDMVMDKDTCHQCTYEMEYPY